MASKKLPKSKRVTTHSPAPKKKIKEKRDYSLLPWFFLVAVLTAVCLWPMLKNEFTNWDDEFYVINNPLLRGPIGKEFFQSRY